MDTLSITVAVIGALLMWRNHLAGSWALRACAEARDLNMADIDAGNYVDGSWRYALIPSHYSVMFDLTQWSYRSPFATPTTQAAEKE